MDAWIGNPELHGDELIWKPAEESADIDMLRPATEPFQPTAACGWSRAILAGQSSRSVRSIEERWVSRSAGALFLRSVGSARSVQGRRARPRRCSSWCASRAPRQRHAGAAQAHAGAGRAAGPRLPGRARHRRAHVRRQRQGPAAIHVSPEALPDGPLARVRDGDIIRLDARTGTLEAVGVDLASRPPANSPPPPVGTGRELFALMRLHATTPKPARRRCSMRWRRSRREAGRGSRCRRHPCALRDGDGRGRPGRRARRAGHA